MNRILMIVACIFFGFIMIGCEGKYKKKNGKIYYSWWVSGGSKTEEEVKGADLKSFKTFKNEASYAIDKNYAYFQYNVIENADVKTFKPLDNGYSVDSKHIFWGTKVLSTADPQTLKILDVPYALDSDSVYYRGKAISGADSKTFTSLGYGYAKDKNAVYYLGNILNEISNPETFQLFGEPEKEMKGWLSIFREVGKPIDDRHYWGCDKDYYYRQGRRIEGADYSTFTFLDEDGRLDYAKDQYHIFYCAYPLAFIVEGADVSTFEILNKYRNFAKDKYNYYYEGKKVSYDYAVKERLIKKP